MSDVVISPIFYMGCKKKLINKGLIDLFPDNISAFVDVFAGSGIVSMNVKAGMYVVNDVDSNLYQLYRLFRDTKADDIIGHINRRIDEYGLARERTKRNCLKCTNEVLEGYKTAYMKLREAYNNKPNVLDFYTLMFYSFSQQFRFNNKGKFNMPCGNDCFTETNAMYIHNGCDFFSKRSVHCFNKDFRELLQGVQFPQGAFLYFDPPYRYTTATYNERNGWGEQEETALYNLLDDLTKRGIKWGMSNVFNNKDVANEGLIKWVDDRGYAVHTFDGFTYVACGKTGGNTREVYITNYEV